MLYFVIAAVFAACTLATIAPLFAGAGAVCTPATHRARQALGVVCALFCVYGIGAFVWFIVIEGHPITANVVVGRIANVVAGAQAWLLLRSVFPRPRAAVPLAAVTAALAIAALVRGVA